MISHHPKTSTLHDITISRHPQNYIVTSHADSKHITCMMSCHVSHDKKLPNHSARTASPDRLDSDHLGRTIASGGRDHGQTAHQGGHSLIYILPTQALTTDQCIM